MALLYRMGIGNGSGSDIKPYTVNFECASGYIGQTLTMTYQGTPHAGETVDNVSGTVASDGTLTLYPMHSGNWECSCYSSVTGTTIKKTIELSYWGTTNVEFNDTPDGATVTPTDDVQTWLHCANIWDKTDLTTIDDVIADTTTLNTLIANENANNYLVRSTSFATDLCVNETAMTYIGLNNYCADTLLNNDTWCNAICNSTYFEKVLNVKVPTMTSNTHTSGGQAIANSYYSGQPTYKAFNDVYTDSWSSNTPSYTDAWIGYMFPEEVRIIKTDIFTRYLSGHASITANVKVQASKDGNTWGYDITDSYNALTSQNSGVSTIPITQISKAEERNNPYKYFRLKFNSRVSGASNVNPTLAELKFYGRKDV